MSTTDIPAIRLQNVRKTYDGSGGAGGQGKNAKASTEAVKGITFDINQGDFFGFLGPNGAGKTTTIKLITGLATITGGTIEVFGHNVESEYQTTRPMIGLAAQEPNFDPFFPLEHVLVFQAGYHGMNRAAAKQRAEELLKRFGLWEHRSKTTRQISGGMKRRLLIAKALVHDPDILILDEPTAGVDVELRHDMWNLLEELNNEGKTIVLTTHYIEEAEKLCNRIGIINSGEIIALEDKEVLMRQLAEKEVEIVTAGLQKDTQKTFSSMEGVTADDTTIRFATEDIAQHLSEVTAVLQKEGIQVIDMNVHDFNLEDIFVQLTEK